MAVFRTLEANFDWGKKVKGAIYKASKSFVPIAQKWYLDKYDREGYMPGNNFINWKDLTNATLKMRAKKGFPYPQYKKLVNSGKLRRNLKVVATTKGINIFNNTDYADEQNDIRPFIYESEQLTQQFANHLANNIASELNNMRWL